MVLLPLVFFILAGLLGPESQADPDRKQPVIFWTDPEEAKQRWHLVEAKYMKDSTRLMEHARNVQDRILREHCRRWAETSLRSVESELQSFVSYLRRSSKVQPDLERQFASHLQRCGTLRKNLALDLEWVRKQDILGLDRR